MRRGTIFWGTVLILAGILILIQNMGLISINIWGVLLPILVIALGGWILLGTLSRKQPTVEHLDIPLDSVKQAEIRFKHGAGRMTISAGTTTGSLVSGDCSGGVQVETRRQGDRLEVELKVPSDLIPWFGWNSGDRLDWNMTLTPDIPLSLIFETGAADSSLDLTSLRVDKIRLSSGASSTRVKMPANAGHTLAIFETGAASLVIEIPQGVAASIRAAGGLSSISVDTNRFPRSGKLYQSVDYDNAELSVEIQVGMGIGSVNIH
jgi:hypothetical protein